MLEPWALEQKKFKKQIAWWLYQERDLQRASLLHATSDEERQQFSKLGLTTRSVTIPNGVDVSQTESPGLLPPRSVLFLSRLHPKKGIELLFESIATNVNVWRADGWRLYVVGPGGEAYRTTLKRVVEMRGISDRVEFRTAVDGMDKWGLLRSAELVVLPTYSENFGLVVAEALSVGTPVITTTGAPWRELDEFRCGWWVAPDEPSISRAFHEAFALSKEEREEMGARGRQLMSERYSWSSVAKAMIDAYESVLRSPSRTGR
jgi:glycosyltransferase involved in cell wall biosynthesis